MSNEFNPEDFGFQPFSTPEGAKLMAQYRQETEELEAPLIAVKGAEYAATVRMLVNLQTACGQLGSMSCGEIPLPIRQVAAIEVGNAIMDVVKYCCKDDKAAVEEMIKNMMNLVETRERLKEAMIKALGDLGSN